VAAAPIRERLQAMNDKNWQTVRDDLLTTLKIK
jgi:hypothetical protein